MKTIKKFLSIILAILMIATSIPFAFAADTTLAVGDQFEADLTKQGSDNNLTFRYVFKVLSLPDAENEYGKLELVKPAEGVCPTVLTITMLTPKITYDGVTFEITSIGDRAFSDYHNGGSGGNELTEINLMLGTVENIGYQAFYYCRKLETANLSPYVDKLVIGMEAFDVCDSIASLQIEAVGGGTVEIGQAAFRELHSLKELNIGYTVSKMAPGAIIDCDALTTLTIDKGALTEIPGFCFSSCEALENVIIPEGITTIGDSAFYTCSSLKSVELPSTMETVVNGSFYRCPLERVVFKGGETVEFGGGYPLPLLTVENGFGDGLYANGQEITITANEKEGYEFVNWEIAEGDGTLADASAAETTYTMGSSTATLRPVYEDIRTECDKGNHEFVNYVKSAEASCGVNAKETAKCENCEVTDTREIEGSALTHSFSKYEEVEAPKCGVAGKKVAACDHGCDATDEKEIPALTHSFSKYEEVEAPKCGIAGKEVAVCDNGCDATDEQEIPALTHSFSKYEEVEAPKCDVAGKEVAVCDNGCDATDEKEIPALTHEPLAAVKENEVYATCKAEGGYDLVVYCDLCGEEIDSEHITTQKLPHTPSGWWATTDTEHYKHCVNDSCDEEIEGTRAAHTYTWKVTTEATATTDGVETGTCVCGYETTRVIPATGETPDPDPEPGTPDEPTDDTCDHLCHSNSAFVQFFWKIIRFLQKLFGIQQYCDCGVAHW